MKIITRFLICILSVALISSFQLQSTYDYIINNKLNKIPNEHNTLPEYFSYSHSHEIKTLISQSEYRIIPVNSSNLLTSLNRAQNMQIFYSPSSFEICNRITENASWKIRIQTLALYRGNSKIVSLDESATCTMQENEVIFHHPQIDIQYINSAIGMRQNFILKDKPFGDEPLCILLDLKSDSLTFNCKENTLSGYDLHKHLQYTYSDLKVWDANHKTVNAEMKLCDNELSIIVNDYNAIYPLTVDPVSANPDAILESNQANSNFGTSVSNAGDVNGDGYGDIIVGAWLYDNGQTDEGRAYVYHGTATGINTTPAAILECDQAQAHFGFCVSGAGDVNNDGYDDVIVGAYLFDDDLIDEGGAFVYHGSAAGIITTPAVTLESNQLSTEFGISVSAAGDVNGDGYDDVIVGADHFTNGESLEGRAFIYHGSAAGISVTPVITMESNQSSSEFGISVSDAGDVNNDGYDDVIVGAMRYDNGNTDEGRSYIFNGSAAGILPTPTAIMESNKTYANFGISVSSAGDVNNDNYDDVIVGAFKYSNGQTEEGGAYIFQGSAIGINTIPAVILEEDDAFGWFGYSVSSGADINNDGYDDVIVGAIHGGLHGAFLYGGSATGLSADSKVILGINQSSTDFGITVSGGGDINLDGYDDVVVGAYRYDNGEIDEGGAFIYNGNNCTPSIYYHDADLDGFGDPFISSPACSVPDGYCTDNTDCDDDDALQNPNTIWYFDNDADHYYAGTGSPVTQCLTPGISYYYTGIIGGGDCDDANLYKNPGVNDQLDGIDNNCNLNIDEDLGWTYGGFLESNVASRQLGRSVSIAGDLNGDGFDDVIAGAVFYTNGQANEGAAYIYYGSATGISTTPGIILESNQAESYFGYSVSGAGDLNNDGYDDIVIGAYKYDNPQPDEGRIYIYLGSSTGITATPIVILEPNQTNGFFGYSVSDAGDVNNDGYDDIIVGAYGMSNGESSEGKVFIYHGNSTGINTIPATIMEINQTTAYFGRSVSDAGDLNNDGYDDVIVGTSYYNGDDYDDGGVFVYLGSSTGIINAPMAILEGNVDTKFGESVSGVGDVNGDGYDDIIVGAYEYADGRVYVYSGSAIGINITPAAFIDCHVDGSRFGFSTSAVGDINNDGFNDIIAGGYMYTDLQNFEGGAFIYLGSSTGIDTAAALIIECNQPSAEFGISLSGSGDINGDGSPDLIIGADKFDNPQLSEGAVFVYYSIGCTPTSELCNTLDDNCNGLIDDGITETISISAGGPTTFCQGGSVVLSAIYSGATVQWKKDGVNIAGATSSNYTVTKKGNYTCLTTSPCGTATSSIINVVVNKNPNASISAGGATTFCAGGSVTLTEVPSGGCTYQWYKGASLIAGATSVNYIATTTGNYKCRVTKTATGCYKNSNAIAVSVPCRESELSMVNGESGFTIYPNPANDKLNIQIETNLLSPSSFLLIITDLEGRTIYSSQLNSLTTEINISDFASGMYFVKITPIAIGEDDEMIEKFIKN